MMESLIRDELEQYLENQGLFCSSQHGFRKFCLVFYDFRKGRSQHVVHPSMVLESFTFMLL